MDGAVYCKGKSIRPLVVSSQGKRESRIEACNDSARQQGIRPGMTVSAARGLVGDLQVLSRNEDAERNTLKHLAAWAGQFTPMVNLATSRDLLLEVAGSLTFFGGKEALLRRVRDGLHDLGHQTTIALAPTPLAAVWLAGAGQEPCITDPTQLTKHVLRLPLKVLGLKERQRATLVGMGLRCIGDCLRLSRHGLARRLGPELLKMLDQALGRIPDPKVPYAPPQRFFSRLLLPAEVVQVAALLFAVRRLVLELCGALRGRNSGVQELHLQLIHQAQAVTEIQLRLIAPGHDAPHLLGLLQERLRSIRLPAPVRELLLSSSEFVPLASCSRDWITQGNTESEQWTELIERLQARLGKDAVHGLCQIAEHRPEKAWRFCAPREKRSDYFSSPFPARPLWLLPEPTVLEMHGDRPYLDGDLIFEYERERIESGWWNSADVARDYFIARNPQGARFWIYRQLRGTQRWFLHGIFG
ncbi:MAG: DNA polymerase Y family protein [Gammaproteobacteria bacterium]